MPTQILICRTCVEDIDSHDDIQSTVSIQLLVAILRLHVH